MSYKAVDAAIKEWSKSAGSDLVAPEYIERRLVFPLGPLVNRTWDASAAHDPNPGSKMGERGEHWPLRRR